MKDAVLDDIMKYATKKLNENYGYCGQAHGDKIAMLNSTNKDGDNIIIKIEAIAE